MKTYKVLAQHMFSTAQATKTVRATSEASVVRMVSKELHDANYYIVSIKG